MRAFWDRMMQVNARAVLGVMVPLCLLWVVVGLILVGRTSTGMELRPVTPIQFDSLSEGVGLDQGVPAPEVKIGPSLFSSAFLVAELEAQKAAQIEREEKRLHKKSEAEVVVVPEVPVQPLPAEVEPAPPPVPVRYLGMMERSGKPVLALLKVGEPAVVHKVAVGDQMGDLVVLAMEGRRVQLRYREDTVDLTRGQVLLLEPVE